MLRVIAETADRLTLSRSEMDPMSGLAPSPEEEKKMAAMIEGMQTRDSLRMYNNLVEKCFSTCVQSFRRKTLEKDEERCVSKCCGKFWSSRKELLC